MKCEAARFGFSAYANEGPDIDRIEPLFRQRQIAEYLLEALLEARPRALFAVKRERTVTKAEREARAAAEASGVPIEVPVVDSGTGTPDYFVIDPRVSARTKAYVDTTAFRLAFTSQTDALGNFLNRLASFELPVLVREVEIDAATAEESGSGWRRGGGDTGGGVRRPPLSCWRRSSALRRRCRVGGKTCCRIAHTAPRRRPHRDQVASKYTVTVEFIGLVGAPLAGGGPPPTP